MGPVPLGAGPTVVVDQAAERAAPAAANPRWCGSACGAARRWPHSGPALPHLPFWWPIVAGGRLRARPRPAL